MKDVILKDKTQISLRKAQVSDAGAIVGFYNFIGGETQFLSFGKDEYPSDVQSQEKSTANTLKSENSAMILALCNGEICGIVTLTSPAKRKSRHTGEMGIGIKQDYCNRGLGTAMLSAILDFAKGNGITKKVSLVTRCDNTDAMQIYKKFGFETEGVLKAESFENGEYYDSIYMGLML